RSTTPPPTAASSPAPKPRPRSPRRVPRPPHSRGRSTKHVTLRLQSWTRTCDGRQALRRPRSTAIAAPHSPQATTPPMGHGAEAVPRRRGRPSIRIRHARRPRRAGARGVFELSRPWTARSADSVERVAAGAGATRVRVVDREALLLDRVDEVDLGTLDVRRAHPVHGDPQAVELTEQVAVELTLVEEQLVAQASTAARLHRDAQVHVVATLLVEQRLRLRRGRLGQDDAVRGLLGCGVAGLLSGRHGTPQIYAGLGVSTGANTEDVRLVPCSAPVMVSHVSTG